MVIILKRDKSRAKEKRNMPHTQTFIASPAAVPMRTAAMYVRMSTDHQKYSTENQADAIREYAQRFNIQVVATYEDAGKSGLKLDGRDALKRLIDDVQSGRAEFSMILVLDVTRWGRFQDADESAYYEYICRRAGIDVQYVAEQFENDGSPVSTIVKGVKRAMAGEYSRELSAKVFAGQCRLIEKGYRQGGPAGYGLRRVLVDEQGQAKAELKRGEHKSLQTDRVILVPGPPEELEVVKWIYRNFIEEGLAERQIAHLLNQQGLKTDLNRPWTGNTVHEILTNEKYIGNNVFNRVSFKLKKRRVLNAPEMWVRANGVYAAVVEPELFTAAQKVIQERSRRWTDDEMLGRLKSLQERTGWLSGILINETEDMPTSSAYASRFGSLIHAYQLVGYTPDRDFRYIEINRFLRQVHAEIVTDVIGKIRGFGTVVTQDPTTEMFTVHNEMKVSVVICRCFQNPAGLLSWHVRLDRGFRPDLTLAVRMDTSNQKPADYYLLPSLDIEDPRLRLFESNCLTLDSYRFDTLEPFLLMSRRIQLKEGYA
jgi:DNA invertase Pin-like site-specific DNA recombinase